MTTQAQNFVAVDLANVAREVVSDLEVQIEQAHGRVEIGQVPTIQADPLQMRQLLQNLITNALKFHRAKSRPWSKSKASSFPAGSTQVGQRVADQQCCIVVEDNGIGFDEKHRERIFGVFQRLHGRDVFEGTGIGLALCRKIVERHGGQITARSTPGHGSVFEILLPVAHRPGETIAHVQVIAQRRTILMVDDDGEDCLLVAEALRQLSRPCDFQLRS